MQALDLQIRVHGWALVQVAGDGDSWCYTVGLLENYGHAELTILDVDAGLQVQVANHLVSLIVEHGHVPEIDRRTEGIELLEVHDDHLRSEFFGTWANRYGSLPAPGEFLQVLLPDDYFCSWHAARLRRLDRPGPLPNREQRRAKSRRRR